MEFGRSPKAAFDDAALDFDRYRPGYPCEAIAALIDLSGLGAGSRLLEAGGTVKRVYACALIHARNKRKGA
jgi:hypothetical protein